MTRPQSRVKQTRSGKFVAVNNSTIDKKPGPSLNQMAQLVFGQTYEKPKADKKKARQDAIKSRLSKSA